MTSEITSNRCDFQPDGDGFKCTKCGFPVKKQATKKICRLELKEPTLMQKVANFIPQALTHEMSGKKECSKEQIQERLSICHQCEIFKPKPNGIGGVCTHSTCGCAISDEIQYFNKLAWADQECPLKKWLKIQ